MEKKTDSSIQFQMKKFRLPRKVKIKLKRNIWLYPADNKGSRQWAFPDESQEDYTALKKGIVTDMIHEKNSKAKRKEDQKKLDREIFVSDEELRVFVDDIFAKEYRNSSYNTLLQAKVNPKAVVGYYNFINAYNLYKAGEESKGNVCCMAVDWARDLLKKRKRKK